MFINIQISSLDRQIDQAVCELGVYPAYSVTVGGRLTPARRLFGGEEEIKIVEGK
ncbi:MAG: hypothetical protein KKB77_03745 [Bacteroidetes bacterium]|nr:hypothetical protein [Bacteroidota bacterium]